jgi:hypothetical protein
VPCPHRGACALPLCISAAFCRGCLPVSPQ